MISSSVHCGSWLASSLKNVSCFGGEKLVKKQAKNYYQIACVFVENCESFSWYKNRNKRRQFNLPITFFDRWITAAVRSGCQATSNPLNWDHIAFSGDESRWWRWSNVSGLHTSCIQDGEYLGVGCVRDSRLASHVVLLDTIAGCDAVLVQQQTESGVVWQVVNSLGLAFNDDFAQFVTANCEFKKCDPQFVSNSNK